MPPSISSPHPDSAEAAPAQGVFGDAPSYADCRPLRWLPKDEPADTDAPERVLAAVAVLEESRRPSNDDGDPVLTEVQYLDAKLDILIDMVRCLYERDVECPPAHEFQMSARALCFAGKGRPPRPDERGLLELHVHPLVVKPLRLAAQVTKVDGDKTGWSAEFHLDAEPESLADALQRHVFRRHRRAVADARSGKSLTED